ncbi:DUF6327 family protein [Flavobacterium muglaense]|uniref:Glutaminyl-tRNA synthetase n=1 Tax=Flavobacterium muglaense TaxID=2764716 RepID=A0A923N2K0_9FLAO|nr:DUF6327 family protein [Flavobacterium muglaense]MBC5839325.1 hypothetical protein [Flavobacterium muglaense]MBC5845837.1 hypothetical protein [Flavobacterium muglaense]
MGTRKYSSYEQIDRELEILKIEKEISLQKVRLEFQGIKENLEPKNIVRGIVGSYVPSFPGKYGQIISIALPFITKWLFKKRGF